jgi:PIN domain nuclease of toxin-antitoxin system
MAGDGYLLDTHALVWAVNIPERLPASVRSWIENGRTFVSTASFWELLVKKDEPGAPTRDPVQWWKTYINNHIDIVPIEWHHLIPLATLPRLHKDPFDRMLICQAIALGFRLVTLDEKIRQYKDVTCTW